MYLFYKPIRTLGLKCRENKRERKIHHLDKQLWLSVKDSGANRVQICSTVAFTCEIVLTELEKVRLASRVSSAPQLHSANSGANGGSQGVTERKVWPQILEGHLAEMHMKVAALHFSPV